MSYHVKKALFLLLFLFLGLDLFAMARQDKTEFPVKGEKILIYDVASEKEVLMERVVKTEEEWKKVLTPEQYDVVRKSGTECAFKGVYWDNHKDGVYKCIGCGIDLFRSDHKFESGTGWPSFFQPVSDKNLIMKKDRSFFMERVEVLCARCGAHLGHVFDDGPPPTHKRYCINSAAMKFVEFK